ncbi:MAG: ATP-binding cassette domain-containing protein [Alphaproteobacteria bacterium]|nr:ATP-binding cassette domain-containing protein [Alphaproteobacteria bacterium]
MTEITSVLPEKKISNKIDSEQLQVRLLAVLSCYDVYPDIQGLLSKLPRKGGLLRSDDIEVITEKLGLSIEKVAGGEDIVKTNNLPALAFSVDGSVSAFIPTLGHQGSFICDGNGKTPPEIVYSLLFNPPNPHTNHAIEHMVTSHSLDWFWLPITRYWREYSEIALCSIFSNLLMLALPLYTMNVYDRVAVNFSESTLDVLTLGVTIALLFDFMFRMTRARILEHVASKISIKFDVDLMERLMSIRGQAILLKIGERANLFRELQGIKDFYAGRLAPALADLPFFFLFVCVIYWISPVLSLIPVVSVVIIQAVTWTLSKPVNRTSKRYFSGLQEKSAVLIEILAGMDTIKMLGARGKFLFKWDNASRQSVNASSNNNNVVMISTNLCGMIISFVTVAVLFVGVHEITDGTLTIGAIIACSLLAGRAVGPMVALSGLLARIKQSSDVLKTIDKIFKLPYEETKSSVSSKGPFKGMLQLTNVSYAYPRHEKLALENISITINPGERVGLIGRTGAGKSTLAKLICQFIYPSAGTIAVDGFNMEAIPVEEWRRTVGYVPQDGFFFSGSMRSNILLGREDVTDEVLEQATRISGLDIILKNTGEGLDMEVGEGGAYLSGGQRQAVALARAIVRDPKFVVLDEPVNGIDNALEATIKKGFNQFLVDRTFIMITHRTSLLSLVDRLILIERGKIIADGPRDEIMHKLSGE